MILFKQQKFQGGGTLPRKFQNSGPTGPVTLTPEQLQSRFGTKKYNSWEDITTDFFKTRGTLSEEDQIRYGDPQNIPVNYSDMRPEMTTYANYWGKGADQFIEGLPEGGMERASNYRNEIIAQNRSLPRDQRRSYGDLMTDVAMWAKTNIRNNPNEEYFIPKSNIYQDMGDETPYAKAAFNALQSRKSLKSGRTDISNIQTAGAFDPEDKQYGWRNLVSPQFISGMSKYRRAWNTDANSQRSFTKKRS